MLNKKTLLVIFLIIQLIAIFQFFRNKQSSFVFETLIIILAIGIITYFYYKRSLPVSNYLYIIVLIAISGHTIGGELFGLYHLPLYDKFLHIFGGYSFALLGYIILGLYKFPLPNVIKSVIIITVGLSLGTIYELWEFAMDQFMKPAIPAQSGLTDTNFDLLADLAGSFLAAFHLYKKPV